MSTALLSSAMRRSLLVAAALLSGVAARAQTPIIATIGTGTSAASTNALLSTSTTTNKYARTISIYSAAELTAAGALPGSIVSIAWFKSGTGEYPTADAQLNVYMKSTTASVLTTNPVDWATEVLGTTPVYSNTALALPTGTGFKTFTLSTPFTWNGTSNVEVLVDWYRASTPTADITWQYTAVGTTGIHATQVNSVVIPTVRFAGNRPNVQLGINTSGTPACSPPTALTAGSITSTSASLAFTASGTATSYTVTYTPQGGTAQTVSPNPGISPVALTGLTPSTVYTVSVVSNCAGGVASTPVTTTFTTAATTVTCNPPTGVATSGLTSSSVNVTFTPPTPAPTGYTITYTPQGGTAQTQTATGSPVALTGLTPNTAYAITVVANCTGGNTSAAAATNVTTQVACQPPTGLAFTGTSSTAGTLSFTPAAGTPGGTTYQIVYAAPGGIAQTVTPNPSVSPVTLTGLTPGANYTLSVRAVCSSTLTSATAASFTFATVLSNRESREAALVALYPNPAHRNLTVSVPAELSTRPVPAVLINSLGQMVQQHQLPATSTGAQGQLDVSQLAAGLYTLRLMVGETAIAKRIVVE